MSFPPDLRARCSIRPKRCTSASRRRSRPCSARLGAASRAVHRRAGSRRATALRAAAQPDRSRADARPLSACGHRPTSRRRSPLPQAAFPLWRAHAGQGARQRAAPRRRHHGAARLRDRCRAGRSRSARTAWKRSAKRRRRSTSSATTPTTSSRTAATTYRCPNDPLEGVVSRNRSVLRPYGVWSVIAPFNFPLALAGGPTAAALITGNTVVVKCASDTPWAGRLLADCIRDAGLPPGVFNYLSGSRRDGRRGDGARSAAPPA